MDFDAMTDVAVELFLDALCYQEGRFSGWGVRRLKGGNWEGWGRGHNDFIAGLGSTYQQAIRTLAKHVKAPGDE